MSKLKKASFALLFLVGFFSLLELVFWGAGWPSMPKTNPNYFEHNDVYWRELPDQKSEARTHGERSFRLPAIPEGMPICAGENERHASLNSRYLSTFNVSSDQNGVRFPSHSVEKPQDVFRVLLLGCSTTFGWGVEDDESLPARLEHHLRAAGHSNIEVINGGQPGYTSYQGRRFFEEVAAAYQPDLVMIGYVIQDSRKVAFSDLSQAVLQDRGVLLKQGFLYRSRLYQALKIALGDVVLDATACLDDFGNPTNKCVYRVSEGDFATNYRAIKAGAEKLGAKVGVYAFPEEGGPNSHSKVHRFLQMGFHKQYDVPFFDPTQQIFREVQDQRNKGLKRCGETQKNLRYYGWCRPEPKWVESVDAAGASCWKLDTFSTQQSLNPVDPGHASAAGLDRIAELFARFLEKESLLP